MRGVRPVADGVAHNGRQMRRAARGMTLIEVLIAMAIVAILAALAYPAYQDSVRKARRTDARAALMTTAQQLERCFTQFMAYNSASCSTVGEISGGDKRPSEEGFYEVEADALTATEYSLTAAAPAGSAQASDPDCSTMTLDSRNVKGPLECW